MGQGLSRIEKIKARVDMKISGPQSSLIEVADNTAENIVVEILPHFIYCHRCKKIFDYFLSFAFAIFEYKKHQLRDDFYKNKCIKKNPYYPDKVDLFFRILKPLENKRIELAKKEPRITCNYFENNLDSHIDYLLGRNSSEESFIGMYLHNSIHCNPCHKKFISALKMKLIT